MIDKQTFKKLESKFSDYSSWTIWADGDGIHPKSGIDDLSIFSRISMSDLHNNFIFVGLNAAKHDRTTDKWCNFHSNDKRRSQDYKLRYALKNTCGWGCYITDFIKGVEITDGNELLKYINLHPEIIEKSKSMLDEELALLNYPTIVAVGDKAYRLLRNVYGESVRKIMHYSSRINKEVYKQIVHKSLCD